MNGSELIAAERARQIAQEGWTPEHDDAHTDHELAVAAVAYVKAAVETSAAGWRRAAQEWPWDLIWFRADRRNPLRSLVKAGALIAAEIDRIQRCGGTPLDNPPKAAP